MKRKISVSGLTFDIFNTLLMIVIFVVMLYPFVYVLNYSLSDHTRIGTSLLLLPIGFNLNSYTTMFRDPAIFQALIISVSRSILGPAVMLVVCGMAGYVLSKENLVFGRFFRWIVFFTMYFSAGLIPIYLTYQNLGLTNNYLVYILPFAVSAFNIVLIRTFIQSLPSGLEEAALIDGANEFQCFWRVIFPICLPVNAAVVLFSAITHWNDFITTQIYNIMDRSLWTIQFVLHNTLAVQLSQTMEEAIQAADAAAVSGQTLRMAMTVITVIPIVCLYPVLQKYFVSGIMVGSIKA